jgi:hypothetical protein
MRSIRRHLSFANAMSVLAMFIALGSGAYAVHVAKHSVGSPQLKKNAVKEKKIANGAVTQKKIADGAVTGAKIADGSVGLADVNATLHQLCPGGTIYLQGACIETGQRGGAGLKFIDARPACGPSGRLPSIAELDSLGRRPGVSWSGFEWSSARYTDGGLPYVTTLNDSGGFGVNSDSNSGFAPFRCVFEPTG